MTTNTGDASGLDKFNQTMAKVNDSAKNIVSWMNGSTEASKDFNESMRQMSASMQTSGVARSTAVSVPNVQNEPDATFSEEAPDDPKKSKDDDKSDKKKDETILSGLKKLMKMQAENVKKQFDAANSAIITSLSTAFSTEVTIVKELYHWGKIIFKLLAFVLPKFVGSMKKIFGPKKIKDPAEAYMAAMAENTQRIADAAAAEAAAKKQVNRGDASRKGKGKKEKLGKTEKVKGPKKSLFAKIKDALMGGFGLIMAGAKKIKLIFKAVGKTLMKIPIAIKSTFTALFGSVKSGVKGLTNIARFIKPGFLKVLGFLAKQINRILLVPLAAIKAIYTFVVTLFDTGSITEALSAAVGAFVEHIITFVSGVMNFIKDSISWVFDKIMGLFGIENNPLSEFLDSFEFAGFDEVAALLDIFFALFDDIVESVTGTIDDIGSGLRNSWAGKLLGADDESVAAEEKEKTDAMAIEDQKEAKRKANIARDNEKTAKRIAAAEAEIAAKKAKDAAAFRKAYAESAADRDKATKHMEDQKSGEKKNNGGSTNTAVDAKTSTTVTNINKPLSKGTSSMPDDQMDFI